MEDVQSFRLMWKSRPKSIAAIVSKSFISKIPNNKTRNGREKRQNTKKKGKKRGKKRNKRCDDRSGECAPVSTKSSKNSLFQYPKSFRNQFAPISKATFERLWSQPCIESMARKVLIDWKWKGDWVSQRRGKVAKKSRLISIDLSLHHSRRNSLSLSLSLSMFLSHCLNFSPTREPHFGQPIRTTSGIWSLLACELCDSISPFVWQSFALPIRPLHTFSVLAFTEVIARNFAAFRPKVAKLPTVCFYKFIGHSQSSGSDRPSSAASQIRRRRNKRRHSAPAHFPFSRLRLGFLRLGFCFATASRVSRQSPRSRHNSSLIGKKFRHL